MTIWGRTSLPALGMLAILVVSGCNSPAASSPPAAGTPAPSAAASAPAGGIPSGVPGGAPDLAKIQECLTAAGLSAGSFAPFPSGSFAFPSGGAPFPSGSFAPPGGFGSQLNNPQVQAALQACGISLPNRPAAP